MKNEKRTTNGERKKTGRINIGAIEWTPSMFRNANNIKKQTTKELKFQYTDNFNKNGNI
jgi:hypothetical protein